MKNSSKKTCTNCDDKINAQISNETAPDKDNLTARNMTPESGTPTNNSTNQNRSVPIDITTPPAGTPMNSRPSMPRTMPRTGRPMNGRPMEGMPSTPRTMPRNGMPMEGMPSTPRTMPRNGMPMNDRPMEGMPSTPGTMPRNGMPMNGMPMEGMPMNGMPINGVPMYPLYGYDNMEDFERDLEYFKQLYPSTVRYIQNEVDNECDKLEYDGSVMFDEYPDRVTVERIVDRIYEKVEFTDEAPTVEANNLYYRPRRRRSNLARDLITIILLNEFLGRRRRYRSRRRWF